MLLIVWCSYLVLRYELELCVYVCVECLRFSVGVVFAVFKPCGFTGFSVFVVMVCELFIFVCCC